MKHTELTLPNNSDSSRLDILLKALRIAADESNNAHQYPELVMQQYLDIEEEVRILRSFQDSANLNSKS